MTESKLDIERILGYVNGLLYFCGVMDLESLYRAVADRLGGGLSRPYFNLEDYETSPKEKCLPPSCFCETGELIRNGGFEIPGVDPRQVFSDWSLGLSSEGINLSMTTDNVYEGNSALPFTTGSKLKSLGSPPVCLHFRHRLVSFHLFLSSGRQDHNHISPFNLRHFLHNGQFFQFLIELHTQVTSERSM
jgi:hypothetical protein